MQFTGERVVPDQMTNSPSTYAEHLFRYIFALDFCKGLKVLDAACGTCYGLEILSGIASQVFGVDNCQRALDYGLANFKFSGRLGLLKNCDLDSQDIEQVLGAGKFEAVISFETIEHLNYPDFFLASVKKILVPNGVFIFSIPNENRSRYHKKIYDFEAAKTLIARYFHHRLWWGQTGIELETDPTHSTFYLGIASN